MSELSRRFSKRRLAFYRPYPKQLEFHEAGRSYRERALLAGTQTGKTYCASNEIAMHLTGEYPDWWEGLVYDFPPLIWTGSETNETSREIIQAALLGTEDSNMKSANMGTGAIPGDKIKKITTRLAGVKDVVDQILVRHKSGGVSRCVLKCHPAGERALMADGFWKDVRDIEVGDYVRCADGDNRMVDQTHSYFGAPVWEVVTRAGSIKGTPNHPMFTQRGKLRIDELTLGDVLEMPDCNAGQNRIDDWRIVWTALMIGDGCLRTRCTPLLSCAEPKLLSDAAAYLPETMRVASYGTSRPYDYKIVMKDKSPNLLTNFLRDDGLWQKKSGEKFVPAWVFSLCREQRILFLFWLWSTDGTVRERYSRYDTTSLQLARDVRLLLLSVGIEAPVKSRGPSKPGYNNRNWIELSGYERIKFDEIGKHSRCSSSFKRGPRPKGPRGEIVEIKQLKSQTVYGCGVPELHELIVEGFRTGNTYDQGRTKWQGKSVNLVWPDEEIPADIYSEALARTQAAENGALMTTFTPLFGMTEVVKKYLHPEPGDVKRSLTMMTIHDSDHYTPEQRTQIIAEYAPHERKTRSLGIPMAGRGMVFPVDIDELSIQPFELPSYYRHIAGVDFGINHPAAGAWLAYDPQTSIMYVYDSYRKADSLPNYHAGRIKARDPHGFIPVAWPHDGLNREKASGVMLKDQYKLHGAHMMRDSARYDDDKGGRQDVEPVTQEILEWMQEGRFRIFSTCVDYFEELRLYHRDDNGNIVPLRDDIVAAVRAAFMMRRKARTKTEFRPRKPRYTQPICGAPL